MYSESFRAGVISLLMYDKVFLSSLAPAIKPRYFETKLEQHIVRAVLEHFKEYSKVPKKAVVLERVLQHLEVLRITSLSGEDIADYLESCHALKEEVQENKDFLKVKALKFCQTMAIRDAILEAADLLQKGDADLDLISKKVSDATLVGKFGNLDHGYYLFEEAGKEDSALDQPRCVLHSGLPWIDRHCKGGLARKELVLFAAPPNTGKSTALVTLGSALTRQGHKGVHFTCEMSGPVVGQMYKKNITKRSDMDLSRLDEAEQEILRNWMKKLRKRFKADIHIAEFAANRLSIEGIVAYLTNLESQHNFDPDWIIVDYLDILERPRHIKEDHLQREWLTLELRAMGIEMNKLMISASQVNSVGAEKQTAMMTDLSGAFAKNMHADIIIGLNQTVQEQEQDLLRTFWLKNRAGRKHCSDVLHTDFERARLEMP